ncbi:ribosomal protein S6 kinase-related protein isoform X4 [Monodelphis domestica]|uniref:ribosomal protein S6 kinase-related protein isoform X4 n=1 Tax=Monodelphis domestica TaxID=13616 RepID=UPI0024E19C89|nr:ribosomal protein S6 kinase-related protein isoform X4 [Monodelphis domestica]
MELGVGLLNDASQRGGPAYVTGTEGSGSWGASGGMGVAGSRRSPPHKQGDSILPIQGPWVGGWKRLLSGVGTTITALDQLWRQQNPQCPHPGPLEPALQTVEKSLTEWPVPKFVALFLPEFPIQPPQGQQQLKVLGFIAKGSFGTVLKVLHCGLGTLLAVKVVPKVEVLQQDSLRQCKEEVSIQRQIHHPFVSGLGGSWQGQRHLFTMYNYYSTDLYSLWATVGCFAESSVRLFGAELALGIAPEVLRGGPYNHVADWWSLGILLFALAAGKFPLQAEKDHVAMLTRVTHCAYEVPASLSQGLSLLLQELLCHNPLQRLRYLYHFQAHPFFRGMAFDPELLQKQPVAFVLEARAALPAPEDTVLFQDFDCDLMSLPAHPCPA